MKEVQFKEPIGLTNGRQFFLNDNNEIEQRLNGQKINFLIGKFNYERYGFSDVKENLKSINKFCDLILTKNKELPETLILAIDELFLRSGYWGKVVTERFSYAEEVIIEHDGCKHYIK